MVDKNSDHLVRAISKDRQIRALAAKTTGVVRRAQTIHKTTVLSTAALGRVLTGGLLVGSMLKSGRRTIIRIKGEGPLGYLIAEADLHGNVRGYVQNPDVELPLSPDGKIDVGSGVGAGTLTVQKNLDLKDPYEGSVELISGEIGEDLTYYFTKSEQTPSSVGLGVMVQPDLTVSAAGGFIVQIMGGADEKQIDLLEENISKLGSITGLISEGNNPENLLEKIFADQGYRILAEKEVEYSCPCSKERTREIVEGLPAQEIRAALQEMGEVEVRCQFCQERYSFSEKEAEEILHKKQTNTDQNE